MVEYCGREKKNGQPCKALAQMRHGVVLGCHTHWNAQDALMVEAIDKVYERGVKDGRSDAKFEAELKAREEFMGRACKHERTHDSEGNQLVKVGNYAYAWPKDEKPLKVGDWVRVPASLYGPARDSVVTALSTDYDGPIKRILNRVEV